MATDREDWTRAEVEATVASYLTMLCLELQGIRYNKSQFRRELRPLLRGRNDSAIERKHMNISAVLIEMEHPHIDGYQPYYNYQRSLLPAVVGEQLAAHAELTAILDRLSEAEPPKADVGDILKTRVDPPDTPPTYERVRERAAAPPRKVDYLKREAANRALGLAGELFVMEYERARLIAERKESLAAKVEHIAKTQGDGIGFDILSFEASGQERLVEVKTTRSGKHTPFFVSSKELTVSRREHQAYNIYRVFSFAYEPKLFVKAGAIDHGFVLDPEQYIARMS